MISLEIKAIVTFGVLLVIVGLGSYVHHIIYLSGETAGKAAVQILWNQDKRSIQETVNRAIAKAIEERDDALAANKVIHDAYEQKLADANTDAVVFAQRMRDAAAQIAASSRTLSKVGDLAGSAAASAQGSADLLGQLVSRVTDFRTECLKNDAALDALVMEIKPQL